MLHQHLNGLIIYIFLSKQINDVYYISSQKNLITKSYVFVIYVMQLCVEKEIKIAINNEYINSLYMNQNDENSLYFLSYYLILYNYDNFLFLSKGKYIF